MDPLARQVLDTLPITVCTVDLDGRITSGNRAWSRFAQSNGSLEPAGSGRSVFDVIAGPAARERIERAMTLLRTGRAGMVHWELPCGSSDEERMLLVQVTPLHDGPDTGNGHGGDAHAVTGFVFSTVDITPGHRSRQALIETGIALSRTVTLDRVVHELGLAVRHAMRGEALAIAVADDDTGALRVVHQFGYDGDPAHTLERALEPAWREALASGRVVVRHGEYGVELTAAVAGADGALGAISVVVDGTEPPHSLPWLDDAERVLATLATQMAAVLERDRLVRRHERRERLEAIGEVSAGVAQELRNPIFGISSAAQLLRFRVRDDPVVEKNVGRILREVERLNRMVTELLDYGRPSALHAMPGDPDVVWDGVLVTHRGRLESRALAIHRQRAAPRARCAIDAEQLAQLFGNVLVNAIDAAPEASDLVLTSATLPSGAWRCQLTNGGPAIPPETLARVFDVFYSTKPGGTGIGLALCQRIAEAHGGAITIESVPEHGTTITIVLPPAAP